MFLAMSVAQFGYCEPQFDSYVFVAVWLDVYHFAVFINVGGNNRSSDGWDEFFVDGLFCADVAVFSAAGAS